MGRPDENARQTKTIVSAINYFTTQDLRVSFPATNAAGRSACNRIECRMVKFSQELSRIVLPHDKFGSHRNSKGEMIDPELEKKKFMHAWQILAVVIYSRFFHSTLKIRKQIIVGITLHFGLSSAQQMTPVCTHLYINIYTLVSSTERR